MRQSGWIGIWAGGAARRLATAIAALLLAAAPAAAEEPEAAPARKIVIELFTSQGCVHCPPADALLAALAERDDVIALSMHVDYWDYLGWSDRFGSSTFSERQRLYMARLGGHGYGVTPQMIIQGGVGHIGPRPSVVNMSIERFAGEADLVAVTLVRDGDTLVISLRATRAGQAIRLSGPLDVIAVGYDGPHSLDIPLGENRGMTLSYHNVARDFRKVGEWPGGVAEISTRIDGAMVGYAVFVQFPGPGRIVGAEKIEF